jgi:hypothetical protein
MKASSDILRLIETRQAGKQGRFATLGRAQPTLLDYLAHWGDASIAGNRQPNRGTES